MADSNSTLTLDRNVIINLTHNLFDKASSPFTSQIYSSKADRARQNSAKEFIEKQFGLSAYEDALEDFEPRAEALEEKYDKANQKLDDEYDAFHEKQQKEAAAFEKDLDKRREALDKAHTAEALALEKEQETFEQEHIVKVTGRSLQAVRKAWKSYQKRGNLKNEVDNVVRQAEYDHIHELRAAHPAQAQLDRLAASRAEALADIALAETPAELKEKFNAWRSLLNLAKAPKAKASAKKAKPSAKKAKAKKAKSARKSSRKGKK